jgi:hypothetical protein
MRRARSIILIVLAISVAVFVFAYSSNRRNPAEICTRYAELRAALSVEDTDTVLALIAPGNRSSFDGGNFMRLDGFARPLGDRSKILILGGDAAVWPKPRSARINIANSAPMNRVTRMTLIFMLALVGPPNARDEWRRASGIRMQTGAAIRRPLQRVGSIFSFLACEPGQGFLCSELECILLLVSD